MKRAHFLISVAWLIHAVSWCVLVIKGGMQLPEGLPGWQAFRSAFAVVWPYDNIRFETRHFAALATVSAVTTILFVLGSPLAVWRGSRKVHFAAAWLAVAGFLVNSHWYVLFGSDRSDLRAGYFLWWFSFALLAAGFFALERGREEVGG